MTGAEAPPLILASSSPRRAELLGRLGLRFTVQPADVDETYLPGEEPAAHAKRLAVAKAAAIAHVRPDALVVGSDTVVVIDGDVLGKPADDNEAVSMLLRLQGREHIVATGVAVACGAETRSAVEQVRVRFRRFDRATAEAYVATGEARDKAGAYGIQGYGAALVAGIEGDYFAVMGLSIVRLLELLEAMGWVYDFKGIRRR